MPNVNKVILIGHLTRDPEVRAINSGTSVCSCGIAVTNKWKNAAGEQKEDTAFIDLTLWGKSGEIFAQYCRKGHPVYVEGRIKQDNWKDKETGAKRSKLGVVVENFQFLKGKEESAPSGGSGKREPVKAPAMRAALEVDDIPFSHGAFDM